MTFEGTVPDDLFTYWPSWCTIGRVTIHASPPQPTVSLTFDLHQVDLLVACIAAATNMTEGSAGRFTHAWQDLDEIRDRLVVGAASCRLEPSP